MRKLIWMTLIAGGTAASFAAWIFYQARLQVPALAFGGEDLTILLKDTVHYMQNDPQWGAMLLANSERAGTIAGYGCTLSSVATAMTNLGHPISPAQLNEALVAEKGFTPEGLLVWSAVNKVSGGQLKVDVQNTPSREGVEACLKRGDYPRVKLLLGGDGQEWVTVGGKETGE